MLKKKDFVKNEKYSKIQVETTFCHEFPIFLGEQ